VACLSVGLPVLGSYNRGGEIRYEHVGGFTYLKEVVHYTKLSTPADRPELLVDFGDGSRDTVPRTRILGNTTGTDCTGDARMSVYTATNTYPGPGVYTIRYDDQNRNGGIVNIPNSVSQSFCVSTLLVINLVLGPNNSVRFDNSPLEFGYVGNTLFHDPRPLDPDGDSLSFELVPPLGLGCSPIAGYSVPDSPPPGWAGLDPALGVYRWHLPSVIGTYTIAIRANEWRKVNGVWVNVGQVTRDMQLCVDQLPTGLPHDARHPSGIRILGSGGGMLVDNGTALPFRGELYDGRGALARTIVIPPGRGPLALDGLSPGLLLLVTAGPDGSRSVHRVPNF